jgi:hypothetical protein
MAGIMTKGGIVITDEYPIIVDMTRTTTNVMFVMITVATTISRRFGRISKVFATRAMKSNKIAGSYVAIIGRPEKIEQSFGAISVTTLAKKKS